MLTRQDYMKDSSNLHHKYYSQFVTNNTLQFVRSSIGMDKIRASTDPHLNDIVKHSHGGAGGWIWDYSPINLDLARECNEVSVGCLPSQSTCTCIGKAAARILLEKGE